MMATIFNTQDYNKEIPPAAGVPLNPQLAPFNFAKPTYLLNEKCTEMNGLLMINHWGFGRLQSFESSLL